MPTAQTPLYCSQTDLESLLSALGVLKRLDDLQSGSPSGAGLTAIEQALQWATAQVRLYCALHYDATALASSYIINHWATVLGAVYVCSRRLNEIPDSLRLLAYGPDGKGGAFGDLEKIRLKKLALPDVSYRNPNRPAYSNVHVDPNYWLRQIRVQRPVSDQQGIQHTQSPDWAVDGTWEI